ncbi:MAG: hypothetical protein KAU21_21610 [Gammaproteobacteria bacterium]|nr:hypothetical protein [Gammaproteobacteria bacterium]
MKTLIVIAVYIVIQACSVSQSYSELKTDNLLELRQKLVIQPDSARINIQYGKVVSYSQIDNYYPHCWFISWKRKKQAQIIEADTFKITFVRQTYELVNLNTGGFRLSALSIADTGLSALDYMTEMHIVSEKQPEIKRLICSHWEEPADAEHLSQKQIQKALGSIVIIR